MKKIIHKLILGTVACGALCAHAGPVNITTLISSGSTNNVLAASTNLLSGPPGSYIYNPMLNTISVSLAYNMSGSGVTGSVTNTLFVDSANLPGIWASNVFSSNTVATGTTPVVFNFSIAATNMSAGAMPFYQFRFGNTNTVIYATNFIFSVGALKPTR